MRPLKYSPQIELPPILRGLAEIRIVPLTARVCTWTPLMKSRSVDPSCVAAMCVQVMSGSWAVPRTSLPAAAVAISLDGRFVSVFASCYTRFPDAP